MLYAYSGPHSIPLHMLINMENLNIIIGEMMFHPEDLEYITQSPLITIFVPNINSSEDASDADDTSWYVIIVRNTKQFQLVVQYLDYGLSFHNVAYVMVDKKEFLGNGIIESCSKGIVSLYARLICVMNL